MCFEWNGVPAIFHFGNQGLPAKIDPAQKPQNPPRCVFLLEWAPAIFHFGNQESPPFKDSAQKPQGPMVVFSVVGGFVSVVGLEGAKRECLGPVCPVRGPGARAHGDEISVGGGGG